MTTRQNLIFHQNSYREMVMDVGVDRPDLSNLPPEVVAYIEALEAALEQPDTDERELPLEPSEPPTTINVITISTNGLAKRTPRHFYTRQRRGGMGVFGMDVVEDDVPKFLVLADIEAGMTVITDHGRAFRVPVAELTETSVAGRGKTILDRFPLRANEQIALVVGDPLPGQPSAFLALVTVRGQVRRIGKQFLGRNLHPGTELYPLAEGGAPAAAAWTSGNDDLLIATRTGLAIRFAERQVPVRGCLGLRVDPSDVVVGVAAADAETGGAFMVGNEGKGTIRLYSGFSANKAPGSGGKTLMKVEELIGVNAVREQDDVFIVSRLGKIIRFAAAEVPAKEGVVQGVNCMALRADECVALAISPGS
jgi:DNA gyrase subunit A